VSEQLEFFPPEPEPDPLPEPPINPMVGLHGVGPIDAICKTCQHLEAWRYAKTYYKCGLRANSHGRATDHRVRWQACGKYESEDES
jgi:hypothetical protein